MVSTRKIHIVGIGASAGGLEAITQLISHLRPDLPCAYVVLQHLSPTYRSMMVEILSRETPLKVCEAQHGEVPAAGTIYVVPANHNALIRDGRLQLVPAPPETVPKPSINEFFISLAAEEGESAIGIVLSGTGSDGTAGLRAIQAAGGITLAQAPETAKYEGMPRAAIDAGVVDHVLSPEAIAARLPELIAHTTVASDDAPPDVLARLLALLKQKLQTDFSGYKVGTLMRRMRRREIATGCADLAAYLDYVEAHPEELEHLARDILISVTAFFRDREAFDALRRAVQEICQRKMPGAEIRVWVAGCASGEEAYSIALLFADVLGERLPQYRVQIFATDLDDEAIEVARRGVYPAAAMSEVPADLLERYFTPVSRAYEADKTLRDMIVFARHNLVSDPPFLRLDLVSCRNVLIYFDSPLQAKVLHTFHFALLPDGYLFLGRSESVAQAEQLFTPVDRRERLFRKAGATVQPALPQAATPKPSAVARRDNRTSQLLAALVEHFSLAAVLCSPDGTILHSAGKTEDYLQFPTGAARLEIENVVVPALRGELLTLLHRARQHGKPQRGHRGKREGRWIRVSVTPVDVGGAGLLLVLFEPAPKQRGERSPESLPPATDHPIEDELVATREHLQTLVEELATANEEMQALHEEAQAANEELQATNEELETANEELRATNEELVSLNEELNVKTAELASLNAEYAHLYDALTFPILVFDQALQLRRFNAPAARAFDLRPTALRQPISRLNLPEHLRGLEALLGRVLAHGERVEESVRAGERALRLGVAPGFDAAGQVCDLVVTLIDVTEITQAMQQLKSSQALMAALMEKTSVLFAMKDLRGAYVFANSRFRDYFAIPADYQGRTDFELLPREIAGTLWTQAMTALRQHEACEQETHLPDKAGGRWLHTAHLVYEDGAGQPAGFLFEARDITATKRAEAQLRITAQVFDQAGEAIVVTGPDTVIRAVNKAFCTITGYAPEEVLGQNIRLLKSGRHSAKFYNQMWQALKETGFWRGEIWNKRKNGEVHPGLMTINRIDNEQGAVEHYVAVFSDITQIKESQRKADYLATHDVLTGLPNRALFHDRLRQALAQARRKQSRVALIFIDLDNFKTINDTLGHDTGDELLKEAARRLRRALRDVDTLARLGGDEFTAILANIDPQGAEQVARRIVDDLTRSFRLGERDLFVSSSIGIAFYPEDGADSATLIKAADTAMYRAKELGRNRVEFFRADLHVRLLKRAAHENALRAALSTPGRLRLVFQPKFDLQTQPHRLVGAEALLRWQDPELGAISPAEFIPVAEASGLTRELGEAVQRMLFAQIAEWQGLGLKVPPIAFNVSPRCIREVGFADRIIANAQSAGVPLDRLQVEITEGALLDNSAQVESNLQTLDAAGVKVAIDDFGTGYSSLAYLKRLPLDELKVDKSFVDGLGEDRNDEAITTAILSLARALGLTTVAEGIETDRQLAWLTDKGCAVGQGYLLARPEEAAVFQDRLAKNGAT
jgi:two-component system CheB/CheR fusion protein